MIDKEMYKKELVRMWDSVRDDKYKGRDDCLGVTCCKECPLYDIDDISCGKSFDVFEMIKVVERWSKEHPPKKYKISQLEYDILKSYLDYKNHMTVDIADYFFEDGLLLSLLKKGYFQGAKIDTYIYEYLGNCEVVDD